MCGADKALRKEGFRERTEPHPWTLSLTRCRSVAQSAGRAGLVLVRHHLEPKDSFLSFHVIIVETAKLAILRAFLCTFTQVLHLACVCV